MDFNWKEYLTLANYLAKLETTEFSREAIIRCSISRAYYAAFCHARNCALARGNFDYDPNSKKDKGMIHSKLIQYYKDQRLIEIALMLGDLRRWRNKSDYNNKFDNQFYLLERSLSHASKIIEKIDNKLLITH